MRNRLFILLLLFVFGMTACFDDDSSLGTVKVGEIEISGLPENASIISYSGNILQVPTDVKAGYPESEMSYAWYIYGGSFKENADYRTYRIDQKGEKDLSYEVNLPSGRYTVVFEVTAPNSYVQTATFPLTVSTPFSQGFYILKETADGNTELDLLTDDGLVGNLMTSLLEAPLAGKPMGLAVLYNYGYIDETDQQMKADNMVHVFAEKDYRAFRTEDMYQTFSRDNLMFGPIPKDEIFCAAMTNVNGIIFLSNKGFYRASAGVSSGKLGVPDIEGGSKFIQSLGLGGAATVFWNEETHSLCDMSAGDLSEENLWTGESYYELPEGFNANNLECLASGLNYSSSGDIAWFVCQDKESRKRLLFQVTAVELAFYYYELEVDVHTVPAGKHLATTDVIAGNGLDASVIYVVDNNELFLYDLETGKETPFSLQGIDGEITYVSNNYFNLYTNYGSSKEEVFNYLVVATHTAGGYKLYFYGDLIGGIPSGESKRTIEGTGIVKGVRFLSTTPTEWPWMGAPPYPYGD